jgi:hypothetical protein
MSCVLASLKVPVAVNCCTVPAAAEGLAGVTTSAINVPVPTVSVVVPVTPEAVAEMVTEPPFLPWHIPDPRREAMLGFEDFQEIPLRFVATLPSLKVPLAVNLMDVPFAILGLAGFTVIETKCAVETVSPVEPLTEPKRALIVVPPVATLVARPCALMVAAAELDDDQMTVEVRSWVLLSLNTPMAVNCFVVPTAMVEFAGVTDTETRVAAVTVRDALPLTDPEVAEIVAVPAPVVWANPVESTVATDAAEEDQLREVSN